ncbi:MAG: hypothetical protein J6B62_09660, partial [Bacteroidales bacterium]|nr:hypothetical protein [Bacteroidales bacterium]
YCGKITNWFARLGVAEILVESASLKVGDRILIIGPTTGVVELDVPEIRVDLKPVGEASKGTYCSVPIDFTKVVAGAGEDFTDCLGTEAPEENGALRDSRLRRSDKVYIWTAE